VSAARRAAGGSQRRWRKPPSRLTGRVFADSNVLIPISVMDLLLALSEASVHEVIWTDDLLDEWERVIVREHERGPESAAQITRTVREFFHDTKIERAEYEDLIDEMPGNDADDHAHMAAAVARQPCTILTSKHEGLPAETAREAQRAGDRPQPSQLARWTTREKRTPPGRERGGSRSREPPPVRAFGQRARRESNPQPSDP